MSVLIVLDNPEDKLMLKKLIAEVIHEELTAASESRHNEIPDDRMLIDQVCKFLGLSKSTVYKATSKRLLPHYKKGRKLYFSHKELKQWITEGKRKTLSELNL